MDRQQNGDPSCLRKLTESPFKEKNNNLMDIMINQFDENSKPSVNTTQSSGNVEINESFDPFLEAILLGELPDITIDDLNASDGVKETIKWLLDRGLPPLPVAPYQNPEEYPAKYKDSTTGEWKTRCGDDGKPIPRFTGKNPSYIDDKGIPRTLNHAEYQKRLPTNDELRVWWNNPTTGIGSLGSWGGTVWIDIDAKNFASLEECEAEVNAWFDKHPAFKKSFTERTQSGGYTVGVRLQNKLTDDEEFTNFSFAPGGKHVGEAIQEGRFKVLAPTVGRNGTYTSINRGDFVEVDSLESIGIYPSSKQTVKRKAAKKTKSTSAGASAKRPVINQSTGEVILKFEDLISPTNKRILEGYVGEDKSNDLATLCNELIGWINWCGENGVPCDGDYMKLMYSAGDACGIDAARVARIEPNNSGQMPATYDYGEITCWKKIKKASKEVFEITCPEDIKTQIARDVNNYLADDELEAVRKLLELQIGDEGTARDVIEDVVKLKDSPKLNRIVTRVLLQANQRAADLTINAYGAVTREFETPMSIKDRIKHYVSKTSMFLSNYYQRIQDTQDYDTLVEFDGYYLPKFLLSKGVRHYEHFVILKKIKGRIKYNEFHDLVEIDNIAYKADDLYREFTIGKFPCDLGKDRKQVTSLIADIAKSKPYHPVREYLKNAYDTHGYTGTYKHLLNVLRQDETNELALRYLEVFGTGAVHRIMNPGCIMRYMLVLVSKHQNIGKSLFCAELSNGWFSEDFFDTKNKDELSKLHSHWVVELSEVDKLFRGRHASDIKACVSTRIDTYRKPYGMSVESHPRPSIFVGTTNEQILNDSTGNTRFMMINIPGDGRMDLDWIRVNREKIWADFYHLAIIDGMLPMLTEEEQKSQSAHNKDFEVSDSWEEPIRKFMSTGYRTSTGASISDILSEALHKNIDDHQLRDTYRLIEILKRIGCESKQRRWVKGEDKSRRWILNDDALKNLSDDFDRLIEVSE
jgi:Virulence-associated protein E